MGQTSYMETQSSRQWSPPQAIDLVSTEHPLLLLISLFLGELSILVMAVAIYSNGHRSTAIFLSSPSGWVLLPASGMLAVAAAVIIRQYRASSRARSHQFLMTVTMNLIMVLTILVASEMAVRFCTKSSREGERLQWKVLMPKSWEQVASSYRQLLDQKAGRLSYLVYDDLMGWTIGPNRRSANGLYHSSLEGIRAPHEGVSHAKPTDKTRIALVGDSFTFAEDVVYEDSWGYQLEKTLGSEFEVLNFGVGGYGVDQAYLRYQKDVRQWSPTVVIMGIISQDVERTMILYHPLTSKWWDFPFSKPRFISQDGNLKAINVPPLTPQDLFSRRLIADVPFLEYDRGYRSSDWQSSVLHRSYLARAVMTLFPPSEAGTPENSDAALLAVNAAILQAFVQSARSEGIEPLVLFFPETNEEFAGRTSMGLRVLQEAGIAYTDLTPCLRPIPPGERFAPNRSHYSAQSNARVAHCLITVVQEALTTSLRSGPRNRPSPGQ